MELPFNTLGEYEDSLKREFGEVDWKGWYEKLKPLVRYSEREMLKQVR